MLLVANSFAEGTTPSSVVQSTRQSQECVWWLVIGQRVLTIHGDVIAANTGALKMAAEVPPQLTVINDTSFTITDVDLTGVFDPLGSSQLVEGYIRSMESRGKRGRGRVGV